MKIAVRYFSRGGNTQKLAQAVAEAVGVQAREVSAPLEEKTEIVFLGSSVYAAGVDDAVKAFIAENKDRIGTIYNFSTAALISSTYRQVQKLAAQSGVAVAAEEFHCRGAFGPMHKNHPDADDCNNAAAFARSVVKKYEEN